jgi:hypothetical protein
VWLCSFRELELEFVVSMIGLMHALTLGSFVVSFIQLVAHRTNGGEGKVGLIATSLSSLLWTAYALIIQDMSMLVSASPPPA